MIMTSFKQNQSPPISGVGGGSYVRWGGENSKGMGGAWLAGPPAGQRGEKNWFHTRKSIREGNRVELAEQGRRHVFKKFLIRRNF